MVLLSYILQVEKSIVFKSSNRKLGMKEANIKWYMYQKFPCIHQYKLLGKIINVSACIHFIIYLVALMVKEIGDQFEQGPMIQLLSIH